MIGKIQLFPGTHEHHELILLEVLIECQWLLYLTFVNDIIIINNNDFYFWLIQIYIIALRTEIYMIIHMWF